MKENLLEFYLNKFYFSKNFDNLDISFVPPILRRKTTNFDKMVLSGLNKIFSNDVENVVFSSRYGEFERLLKIIEQYSLNNEISPNVFSSSVHNYPVGFFLFNIKKPIPYTALSGMSDSFSSGLISSIVSKYDNIIYCYCDILEDKPVAIFMNISKNQKENPIKYNLEIQNNENIKDDFDLFESFLNNEKKSYTSPMFKIERIDL